MYKAVYSTTLRPSYNFHMYPYGNFSVEHWRACFLGNSDSSSGVRQNVLVLSLWAVRQSVCVQLVYRPRHSHARMFLIPSWVVTISKLPVSIFRPRLACHFPTLSPALYMPVGRSSGEDANRGVLLNSSAGQSVNFSPTPLLFQFSNVHICSIECAVLTISLFTAIVISCIAQFIIIP